MSFEKKVNEVIGKPYDSINNHCYSLVMYLLPDAPKVDFVANSIFNSIKKIDCEIEALNLKIVTSFKNKDIILLGQNEIYHHVGVFYENGVIHSDSSRGVVYDNFKQLEKIYSSIKGIRI